jgi:anti-sigma factor (TIGR02949 family)
MDASTPETPLACSEVVRALWEYLDGRAGTDLVQCIDLHLALCDGCRAHFEFEERLIASISELRKEHADPARLRAEVLRTLRAAGLGDTRPPP